MGGITTEIKAEFPKDDTSKPQRKDQNVIPQNNWSSDAMAHAFLNPFSC